MSLTLLSHLNEQASLKLSIEADAPGNIAALMEGFSVSTQVVCEGAAELLSNVYKHLMLGSELSNAERDVNVVTALKILGSPINRNVVNVKPPLFKLLVQRAGEAPNVDGALQKLAHHPEFSAIRRGMVEKFQQAAGDKEKAQMLAAEVNQLQKSYARLADKLKASQA